MMDFSAGAGQEMATGLIPEGQLCWVIVNVRGVKASQKGGAYLDVELTVDDGQPYAKRKIWEMIGDPNNMGNSEAYRQMGTIAICRILEAGRGAGPTNPAAYQLQDYSQLSNLRVPVRVRVEKGTGGYEDKNKVAEWLTPNPASKTGHADYLLLQSGAVNKNAGQAPAAQPAAGFGGFGGQQPAQQPGFSQPQPQGAPGGFAQTAATPQQNAPAFPSSQPSGWLAQAQG